MIDGAQGLYSMMYLNNLISRCRIKITEKKTKNGGGKGKSLKIGGD